MKINKQAISLLQDYTNVAIYVHINPDGDCLGAASALKQALVSLNKQVDIYCDSIIPKNYQFIKHMSTVNKKTCKSYDLAVAVDCSDLKRLGCYANDFKSVPKSLKIDHHETMENFANINVTEIVSSTCLILYYYLKDLNVEINADIACALYAGISSDTGCFMHNNTTALEHEVCAELLKFNFDLNMVNINLFKYCTVERFNLLKLALSTASMFYNGKLGIINVTQNDLIKTNATTSDTTGFVNYITNVNTCEVGAIIYEEKAGLFKCSLRSKGNVDVRLIAESFGGGGHKYASGCNIFGSLNSVIKKVVDACYKPINKLEK